MRLWRAPDHTRVVLDLSASASFTSFALENPDRFVVDLAKSQLKTSLSSLPLEGTPILKVRSGVRKGTDLRLVFDLVEKVRTSVFILPPNESTGHRVVIDLFDDEAVGRIRAGFDCWTHLKRVAISLLPSTRAMVGKIRALQGPEGCAKKQSCWTLRGDWRASLREYPGFSR